MIFNFWFGTQRHLVPLTHPAVVAAASHSRPRYQACHLDMLELARLCLLGGRLPVRDDFQQSRAAIERYIMYVLTL